MLFMGVISTASAKNTSDQIFMTNGETIAVKVKQVAPFTITDNYVVEDSENILGKEAVTKILGADSKEIQLHYRFNLIDETHNTL